ncbi:MAG: DUF262 domain-containing protein [Anaerolineales bacterium]|nr:DUF262 domain-containing protein [Anaerolineales bacterium]
MTDIPKIEARTLNISDLLQDFYAVPDFQREYVWEESNVLSLLQDTFDEFSDDQGVLLVGGKEYFIGSIVVCRDEKGTYQLIDGQQRMTTCYLTLCVIRDRIAELGETPPDTLKQQIAASQQNPDTGDDEFRCRLVLQYEDSDQILDTIARSIVPIDQLPRDSRKLSVKHILAAYDVIEAFLEDNFGNNVTAVKAFRGALTNRVKLIRIETPNLSHALKVFETVNARGVGLNAMDLLKNLIFMRASQSDFTVLKKIWEELTATIENSQEKPLRFLRYYILSHFAIDVHAGLREDDIYDWFRKNEVTCGIDKHPMQFAKELLSLARVYANYASAKDPLGNLSPYLKNIARFSGAARQHFILLLAGNQLSPEQFNEMCRVLEKLLFSYFITREQSKTLERNFATWSSDLRSVHGDGDLQAFISGRLNPEIVSHADQLEAQFSLISQKVVRQQYRLRYIITKLTQFVQREAYKNPGDVGLDQYWGYHIEHILPQTPSTDVKSAFDKPELYFDYVQRLGNLALLEQPINSSISNGPYDGKKAGYHGSSLLLTKSMVESIKVGSNTTVNRIGRELLQFSTWDSAAIDARQQMLARLARRVWASVDDE